MKSSKDLINVRSPPKGPSLCTIFLNDTLITTTEVTSQVFNNCVGRFCLFLHKSCLSYFVTFGGKLLILWQVNFTSTNFRLPNPSINNLNVKNGQRHFQAYKMREIFHMSCKYGKYRSKPLFLVKQRLVI